MKEIERLRKQTRQFKKYFLLYILVLIPLIIGKVLLFNGYQDSIKLTQRSQEEIVFTEKYNSSQLKHDVKMLLSFKEIEVKYYFLVVMFVMSIAAWVIIIPLIMYFRYKRSLLLIKLYDHYKNL